MMVEEIFGDLPTIETPRLILRKVSMVDLLDMFAYSADPEVTRFLTWEAHTSLDQTEKIIRWMLNTYAQKQVAPWCIAERNTGRSIGVCGYNWWQPRHGRAEISYMLARSHWGRGLATEAMRAVTDFGFQRMDLNRAEALVHAENHASRRVLEKLGMQCEGTLRKVINLKGAYHDHLMYSLLREEWAAATG